MGVMSLAKVGAFEVPEAGSAALEMPEIARKTESASAPLTELQTILLLNPISIVAAFLAYLSNGR
jgi:hypothetical protein